MASQHGMGRTRSPRSEEHTSELQSRLHLVCRLLLEKKIRHCGEGACGPADANSCPSAFPSHLLRIRRALQRHTWQHGCTDKPCGRKRGADCLKRFGGGLVIVPTKSRAGKLKVGLPSQLALALLEHKMV